MIFRKIRGAIHSCTSDIAGRLFLQISIFSSIAMIVMFVISWIEDEPLLSLIITGATAVIMICSVVFCVKTGRVKAGKIIVSFLVIFVIMPFTFFTGGAIYGGAPLWFAFGALFVNLILNGKIKVFFLAGDAAAVSLCYWLGFKYPELVAVHSINSAYLDSFVSLLVVSAMISLIVGFEIKCYKDQSRLSEERSKEIEELSSAQNRFFSSMSHEIRTPINTIIGLNEMILREENISKETAEDAAAVRSASEMLLHLVNDILDMSKFESGRMELVPVTYNTGDMLSGIVDMLWYPARNKGLEFRIDASRELPAQLIGDEVRIKQILINVLNNAIKYTKEGSVTLSIQCEKKESSVNVIYTVTDTGIGIKKESMPYLFTAFKRVDQDQNRHIEGTGLGLAIVKQFVELMGGKITVNSIYTKGTTFIVEIPQKFAGQKLLGEVDIAHRRLAGARSRYKTSFEAPDARVLAVDDNTSNLMVVSKLLRGTKVRIDTAENGEAALRCTLENAYDLVLMDHMMPEMDGIECMKRIRTQVGGLSKDAKIIALTANAGSDMEEFYEKQGFDGYLLKPVKGEQLENCLLHMLPRDLVRLSEGSEQIVEDSMLWIKENKKKRSVTITTESVADLPARIISEYQIGIIDHKIITESGVFSDRHEIDSIGLLKYMDDPDRVVRGAPPSVEEHETFFAEQLGHSNNVVHLTISGKIVNSGYPMATEAARAFDNVSVFDTGHLSSGQGIMTIMACRLAQQGFSPVEIIRRLEEMKKCVHTSFIVDSMDFLARAHQVSGRIASLTKAFMMHPVLVLRNGRMTVGRFFLGSKQQVWSRYIRSVLSRSKIDRELLFITYVGLTSDELEYIRGEVEKRIRFENIVLQKAAPTIAANCGPGTFGLLFMTEDKRESFGQ
ncbi:MAG: DegV family EDD domain-containing protein [Ruminococcus sp.]|nr:DegV family EDD domain-containing protein [Ruminococcus sp.]